MTHSPTHDVVVLGTGAAGLVAALAAHQQGASVGLYEKGEVVGGTTALSGGVVWIPNNPHAAAAGLADSREEALAYLDSLSLGMIDPELAATLVDTGPDVVRWLEQTTPLRFEVIRATPTTTQSTRVGSRAVDDRSIPASSRTSNSAIGQTACARASSVPRLRLLEIPLGGGSGSIDTATQQERDRLDVRGRGHALIGGLLAACLDRGIVPVTGARAEVLRDQGRVVGARFESGAPTVRGECPPRSGPGDGWFRMGRRARADLPARSDDQPDNDPDEHRRRLAPGARRRRGPWVMGEAWWVPTVEIPGEELYGRQRARLILRERTLPGSIMVNRRGRRFANEAANYNAFGGALHQLDPARFEYANLPCWLVFDNEYLRRYGFIDTAPGAFAPSWVAAGSTLEELAETTGIDATGLVATVARWNELVARATTTTSVAETAHTTDGLATSGTSDRRRPPSDHSPSHRSTLLTSTVERWAQRAALGRTAMVGFSTSTAGRSRTLRGRERDGGADGDGLRRRRRHARTGDRLRL